MLVEQNAVVRESLETFKETHPDLNSVTKILSQYRVEQNGEEQFVQAFASQLTGGSREARLIYRMAANIYQKSSLVWANLKDAIAPHYRQTLFNNLPTELPHSFLSGQQDRPGYDRLFGSLDFIECDHCRSIFGPAAYFVDLMRFVESNITQNSTNTIPNECSLSYRRPDLAKIQLDCHNSHDLIPYIDLVNELLEAFIKTTQTEDAYSILKEAVFPIGLPFHRPLAEIRAYLKHLKTSLVAIYKAFEAPKRLSTASNRSSKTLITREFLELSPQEFSLIVTSVSKPDDITQFFGGVDLAGRNGLENVDIFLKQTGLTHQQLNNLIFQDLAPDEVNAGLSRLFFINSVNDGLGYLTIAHNVVDANDPTGQPYDKLMNLSVQKLDRIHRFLRLSTKLGWSFVDLDGSLRAAALIPGGTLQAPYTPETVLQFDGINDYVACEAVQLPKLGDTFTLEAWVNPAQSAINPILAKGIDERSLQNGGKPGTHFLFWIDASRRLAFTTDTYDLRSSCPIPLEEFTHVAVVVEPSQVTFYINGKADTVYLYKLTDQAIAKLPQGIAPRDLAALGAVKDLLFLSELEFVKAVEIQIPHIHSTSYLKLLIQLSRTIAPALTLTFTDQAAQQLTGQGFTAANLAKLASLNHQPYTSGVLLLEAVEAILGKLTIRQRSAFLAATRVAVNPISAVGTDLNIGKDLGSHVFTGMIKDVRIWAGIRTDSAIAENRYRRFRGNETNLVGYWPLTASVGNGLLDLSHKNHGSIGGKNLVTQPKWVQRDLVLDPLPGHSDGIGLQFDGIQNYLGAKEVNYPPLRSLTFEAWVKPQSWDGYILIKGDAVTARTQVAIGLTATGKLFIQSSSLPQVYESSQAIPKQTLSHVAITLSRNAIKFYVNGQLDREDALTVTPELAPEGRDLNLGRSFAGKYFEGALKEVRLWSAVRTRDQLVEYQYHPVFMGMPDLLGYWQLNQVVDDKTYDLSVHYNHLWLGGIDEEVKPRAIAASPVPNPRPDITRYGLRFDGDNDVIVISNEKNWGLGKYEQLTLEFWFQATGDRPAEQKQVILSQGDDEAGLSVYLFKDTLHVLVWNKDLEETEPQQSLFQHPINLNQWYHLAVVHNEFPNPTTQPLSTGVIEFRAYLDGNPLLVGGKDVLSGFRLSPVGELYLGGLPEAGITCFDKAANPPTYPAPDTEHLYFFTGYVADLRLWKRARSQPDIKRDRSITPVITPDLVAYFPTAEGQGGRLRDLAGKTHNNLYWGTLQTRNIAFVTDGTPIALENVFSHYYAAPNTTPHVRTWTNYIYSGRMYIKHDDAGIGVTFLSQYPDEGNRFYRLQRHSQNRAFHLVAHPYGRQALTITKDMGIVPQAQTWYRFAIWVESSDAETHINVKIWEDRIDEPDAAPAEFQIKAIDSSSQRLRSGTVGVWAFGDNIKQFDRLKVETIPTPQTPSTVLLADSFESYSNSADPAGWRHTSDRITFDHTPALFKAVTLDATKALGVTSEQDIQCHYENVAALSWTNYRFTGKIRFTEATSKIGVSFCSRYPSGKDQYYWLGRDRDRQSVYLGIRPYGIQAFDGNADTGVSALPNSWYRFHLEVRDLGNQTNIKAKIWNEADPEPVDFQADVTDSSTIRLAAGTIGLLAGDTGTKYFDDLAVARLDDVLYAENFEAYPLDADPANWLDTTVRITFTDSTLPFKGLPDPTNSRNTVYGISASVSQSLDQAYSHYTISTPSSDPLTWTDYVYTGKLYLADLNGSIGVTVLSRYPANDDRCYVLRYGRSSLNTFHLAPRRGVTLGTLQALSGTVDSGVVAKANTWYNFQIEVTNDIQSNRTRIRAKLWQSNTPQPQTFQIDATDAESDRLTTGTVGLWAADGGAKYFADLQVQRKLLYRVNLEQPAVGSLPTEWVVTREPKSQPPNTVFSVINSPTGSRALGTTFGLRGNETSTIHAHYTNAAALQWSQYTYTGRMYLTDNQGGIGVTFFGTPVQTGDTVSYHFYRLRSEPGSDRSFQLRADFGRLETSGITNGTLSSGVTPELNTWYWFHIEVENTPTRTNIRAKVWKEGSPVPTNFQMRAYDQQTIPTEPRRTAGTIGVYAEGRGAKYFDNLQVSEGLLSLGVFTPNQHPTEWLDTGIRLTLDEDVTLFKVVNGAIGKGFGTSLELDHAASHLTIPEARDWSNYQFSGKMRLSDRSGGIGVNVFSSQTDSRHQSYRLGYGHSNQFKTFHLTTYSHMNSSLQGVLDSTIQPQVNVWYCFRIAVASSESQTLIQAKIWVDGTEEPIAAQIKAVDSQPTRLKSGTVGVWGTGKGIKSFDDLLVVRRWLLLERFNAYEADDSVSEWRTTAARSLYEADDSLFKTLDVVDNNLKWAAIAPHPVLPPLFSEFALAFDGIQTYLAATKVQGIQLQSSFTLEAWVRVAPRNQRQPIVSLKGQDASGTTRSFWFGIDNQKLTLSLPGEDLHYDTPLVADQLVYVAASVDDANLTLYVAGIPQTRTLSNPVLLNVSELEVGRHIASDDAYYFATQINELRLWTTARSADELAAALYHRPSPQDTLVGFWVFGDSNGTQIPDRSARPAATDQPAHPGNPLLLGGVKTTRYPSRISLDGPEQGFWRSDRNVLAFSSPSHTITYRDTRDTSIAKARKRRTVEVWFQVNDKTVSHRKQVIYHEGDAIQGLVLYVYDSQLYFGGYSRTTPSNWQGTCLNTTQIESGQWHHAAIVLDGRKEVRPEAFKAYLDGKWVGAGDGSQLWEHTHNFALGSANGDVLFHPELLQPNSIETASTHFFEGRILELRIWNGMRSPTTLANSQSLQGNERGLELWWHFDNATDTQILDSTSNGHQAVLKDKTQLQPLGKPAGYTLTPVVLDEATLAGIATIKRLKDTYSLSIDRLIALWTPVKHTGKDDGTTLFDQVFNPKDISSDRWPPYIDQPIRWDKSGQGGQGTIRERDRQIRARLKSALRLPSDTSLDAAVQHLSGEEIIIDIDRAYLNRLYQLTQLSKVLRLPISDVFLLLNMLSMTTVETVDDLLKLVEQAEWLQTAELTVLVLQKLLADVSDNLDLFERNDEIPNVAKSLLDRIKEVQATVETFNIEPINQCDYSQVFEKLEANNLLDDGIVTSTYTSDFNFDALLADLIPAQAASNRDATSVDEKLRQQQINAIATQLHLTLQQLNTAVETIVYEELATLFDVAPEIIQTAFQHLSLLGINSAQPAIVNSGVDITIGGHTSCYEFVKQIQAVGTGISNLLEEGFANLTKVTLVATTFELTALELAALLTVPEQFSVSPIVHELSLQHVNALVQFKQLKTAFADAEPNQFLDLLLQVHQSAATLDPNVINRDICNLTGWEFRQLELLIAYFGQIQPFDAAVYATIEGLSLFKQCFDLAQTLQVDISFLTQLATTSKLDHTQEFEGYRQQAALLLNMMRSRYSDDDEWQKVYKPIRDDLSVRQRDALLAQAMKTLRSQYQGRKDPDILYEYFLLDMQVGSEVETSRIVQATASLQLYVQRCLMNLERGITPAWGVKPETIPLEQWEWVKNYRVWEANRKVFLYPENYIEPELRDTKTPFFEELEQELMQTDINQETVAQAYLHYLEKFKEVATLRIVGSYFHEGVDESGKITGDKLLYLIGRTNTDPQLYYYRIYNVSKKQWLPWQKIELTIASNFVAPVFAFNKLFLFWSEIKKVSKSVDRKPKTNDERDRAQREGLLDSQGYLLINKGMPGRVQENIEAYTATVKYSYLNFSGMWVQPQTYFDLPDTLREDEYVRPEWQRVYAQRTLKFFDQQPTTTNTTEIADVLKIDDKTNIRLLPSLRTSDRLPWSMEQLTWSFWVHCKRNTSTANAEVNVFYYDNTTDQPYPVVVKVNNNRAESPSLRLIEKSIHTIGASNQAGSAAQIAESALSQANSLKTATTSRDNLARDFRATLNNLKLKLTEIRESIVIAVGMINDNSLVSSIVAKIEAITQLIDKVVLVSDKFDDAFVTDVTTIRNLIQHSTQPSTDDLLSIATSAKAKSTNANYITLILHADRNNIGRSEFEYGKWHHITFTLSWNSAQNKYDLKQYIDGKEALLLDDNSVSQKFLNYGGHRLPLNADLAIGSQTGDPNQQPFQVYLSEFQLWNRVRSGNEINNRKNIRIPVGPDGLFTTEKEAVFVVPLNTAATGRTIVNSGAIAGSAGDSQSPSALTFTQNQFTIIENRERVLIFYGDSVGSFHENLDDQKFTLELKTSISSTISYDLDLSSSRLVITETNGLSFNDYAKNSQSTVNRYLPGNWRRLSEIVKESENSGQFQEDADFIAKLLFNNTDSPVLSDVSLFEAALMDVNNQPGWYILSTADEQLLVTIDSLSPKTARERLSFEYVSNIAGADTPQPLWVSFKNDAALQATPSSPTFKLKFERLSTHAVHQLSRNLFRGGVEELLSLESQQATEWVFDRYKPTSSAIAPPNNNTIDFDGAHGIYYWEIFFHIPFLIANRLNANQNFADAQTWYHYIFNPSAQENLPTLSNSNDRYWQFIKFRNLAAKDTLDKILSNEAALARYYDDPFDPHAIAALRVNAYQKAIVMKYIDNLLDWGDSLFMQDTRESVNESIMLYILAYNLLGPRPVSKTVKELEPIGTYEDINRDYQRDVPDFVVDLAAQNGSPIANRALTPHTHLITSFCIPENEKFIGYWDRVADRLFKIRHSQNFEGTFRQLALFEPPIDPMALVQAIAGGGSVSSAVSGLSLPVPHYRYGFMLDKAKDMVSTVIDFGSALLSAIENRDAAKLEILQNTQERAILNLTTSIKQWERDQAQQAIDGLQITKQSIEKRRDRFKKLYDDNLISEEVTELVLFGISQYAIRPIGTTLQVIAGILGSAPTGITGAVGPFPMLEVAIDGDTRTAAVQAGSDVAFAIADLLEAAGAMTAKMGEYKRRRGEWEFERDIAKLELDELEKQIASARVQLAIAEREITIHNKTIEQNQEIADFYRDKFSNQELYSWMINRLINLYRQAYNLAFGMAKSAERAMQYELPSIDTFITPSHWNSAKQGLLAGESLMLELMRMEKYQLSQDSRFQEIDKFISMKKTFPAALLLLLTQGECEFELSEYLFNLDFPGHYFRVIKTMGISLQVALKDGKEHDPYESAKISLIQLSSKALLSPDSSAANYLMTGEGDPPDQNTLRVNWRANQQIAICSTVSEEGISEEVNGMFNLDFIFDNRYFPFEGTGAISRWRLEMLSVANASFLKNYDIEDIIIHVRYTSKVERGGFRNEVIKQMKALMPNSSEE